MNTNTPQLPNRGSVLYPPDKAGARKGPSPWDMSIDELINYRRSGAIPKRIFDVDALYALGKAGVSLEVVASLMQTNIDHLISDPANLRAWQQGRAELSLRARTAIVEHAVSGSLDAAKYLDRALGGDKETINVVVSNDDKVRKMTDEELTAALEAAGYAKK